MEDPPEIVDTAMRPIGYTSLIRVNGGELLAAREIALTEAGALASRKSVG